VSGTVPLVFKYSLQYSPLVKEVVDGHYVAESSKGQAPECLGLKKRSSPNGDGMLAVCGVKLRFVSSLPYQLRRVDMLERTEHASGTRSTTKYIFG
jgi:hypothetical protein